MDTRKKQLKILNNMDTLKLEKIFALAHAEILKLKEECQGLKDAEKLNNTIQEFCKIESQKSDEFYKQHIFELLGDKQEAYFDGVIYTYKPQNRFTVDLEKLNYYCLQNGINMKEMFYSNQETKPQLKIKLSK